MFETCPYQEQKKNHYITLVMLGVVSVKVWAVWRGVSGQPGVYGVVHIFLFVCHGSCCCSVNPLIIFTEDTEQEKKY